MDATLELLQDVCIVLGKEPNEQEWDTKIEFIGALINEIKNPYSRKNLKERYVTLLAYAKRVPTSRAKSYDVFKNLVSQLTENFV
jgi:hypothetical protein